MLEDHFMCTLLNLNAQSSLRGTWDGLKPPKRFLLVPHYFVIIQSSAYILQHGDLDTSIMSLQFGHWEKTSTYKQNSYRHLSKTVKTG